VLKLAANVHHEMMANKISINRLVPGSNTKVLALLHLIITAFLRSASTLVSSGRTQGFRFLRIQDNEIIRGSGGSNNNNSNNNKLKEQESAD
jgi:hypothetical protein